MANTNERIKNNVLFILHMPPPIHGAAIMGKYIHDSEIINSEFDCHFINLATASRLEDIGKFNIKKVLMFCRLLRQIRKSVKDIQPQLVYVTPNAKGGPFYKDYVVVMMLKRMGCKIVAHYQNKGVQTRQDKWLDNILYKRFFKNIKIILLADPLYQDVSKYVKREDTYICPNASPQPPEQPVKKEQPETEILFLSNLLISKGILVLLQALAILRQKGCNFHCTIGGGETKEISASRLQEEIIARGLQEVVNYKGQLVGNAKESALRKADIFIFPTFYHNETFGIVLIEAMSHCVPCITTNEGGIPTVVEDGVTGFITEKNSPTAVAEKTEYLIHHPELRQKMGEAGRKRFLKLFTIEVFERRLTQILKTVIESQP